MRPLTAPAFTAQYAFRCTTAGTASTEPAWPLTNNATVTTGGATFTNVSGQSAYGWSAAAGNLYALTQNTTRFAIGDRCFLSSDHGETNATSGTVAYTLVALGGGGYGVVQVISVNRAGSVPPVAADYLAGATILWTGGNAAVDNTTGVYYQGVTFNLGGSGSQLALGNSAIKAIYLKNCALVLSTSNTGAIIVNGYLGPITLDNTTVQFNAAGQRILCSGSYPLDLKWIGTASATLGTVPTTLFVANTELLVTVRGVDLSAITTALFTVGVAAGGKLLFDSCRIASGVARLATGAYQNATDEVELTNCFDGTNIISERHTPAGDLTTNRTTTLTGGAQDDVGLFSHQLVSSARSDMLAMTLDSFWMDVENAFTGGSRTATVEIISSSTLNNTDIALQLEYLGTAGSSLATFASSLPNALTASAALPTSTAVWNGAPGLTLNPSDKDTHITLSNGNLTATGTAGWTSIARAVTPQTAGKFYCEVACTTFAASQSGIGLCVGGLAVATTTPSSAGPGICAVAQSGQVYVDGSTTYTVGGTGGLNVSFGTIAAGTTICIAVDLTAKLMWYRLGAGGNWNANATRDPAAGTGGIGIPNLGGASAAYPTVFTGGADVLTVNFGATTYVGTPPSGFGNWPGSAAQRLQATFTPQQAGRLRGLVRLGKVSTTVYVNPQITVS